MTISSADSLKIRLLQSNCKKKFRESEIRALALWFAFYNFARKYMTFKKETPTMANGLEDHVWKFRELIDESAKF